MILGRGYEAVPINDPNKFLCRDKDARKPIEQIARVEEVYNWIVQDRPSPLYIYGEPGIGKTSLLLSLRTYILHVPYPPPKSFLVLYIDLAQDDPFRPLSSEVWQWACKNPETLKKFEDLEKDGVWTRPQLSSRNPIQRFKSEIGRFLGMALSRQIHNDSHTPSAGLECIDQVCELNQLTPILLVDNPEAVIDSDKEEYLRALIPFLIKRGNRLCMASSMTLSDLYNRLTYKLTSGGGSEERKLGFATADETNKFVQQEIRSTHNALVAQFVSVLREQVYFRPLFMRLGTDRLKSNSPLSRNGNIHKVLVDFFCENSRLNLAFHRLMGSLDCGQQDILRASVSSGFSSKGNSSDEEKWLGDLKDRRLLSAQGEKGKTLRPSVAFKRLIRRQMTWEKEIIEKSWGKSNRDFKTEIIDELSDWNNDSHDQFPGDLGLVTNKSAISDFRSKLSLDGIDGLRYRVSWGRIKQLTDFFHKSDTERSWGVPLVFAFLALIIGVLSTDIYLSVPGLLVVSIVLFLVGLLASCIAFF